MRTPLPILIAVVLALFASAIQASGSFLSLCYHEVESDDAVSLTTTAVRVRDLAAQFAWLQANGYRPISLQQIIDARKGGASLPDKAVLLTFGTLFALLFAYRSGLIKATENFKLGVVAATGGIAAKCASSTGVTGTRNRERS